MQNERNPLTIANIATRGSKTSYDRISQPKGMEISGVRDPRIYASVHNRRALKTQQLDYHNGRLPKV